jgi:parallel beta-helix repeat protein
MSYPNNFQDGQAIQALDQNVEALAKAGYAIVSGLKVEVDTGNLGSGNDTLLVNSGDISVGSTIESFVQSNLSIGAADDKPRKDLVVFDPSLADGNEIMVIEGTPDDPEPAGQTREFTEQPSPPTLAQSVSWIFSGSDIPLIPLAEIWIPAGATSIASADVMDRRQPVGYETTVIDSEQIYTESRPVSVVVYKDASGTIRAVDSDSEVASGTDAATVIQSAINTLPGSGGRIHINSGVYLMTSGVELESNVRISGNGRSTVLKVPDTASTQYNVLQLETITQGVVDNITIDGNRGNAGSTQYGIFVSDSTKCKVTNCYVLSTTGVGIHLYKGRFNVIANNHSWNNRYHGIEPEFTQSAVIDGNICENNDRHGIYVFRGELPEGEGSKHNIIDGNVLRSNGQYGIALEGVGTWFNIVTNNTINWNTDYGITTNDQADHNLITGNTIAFNGLHGYYSFKCSYNSINNNLFQTNGLSQDNAYDDIMLDDDDTNGSTHNIVQGNMVRAEGSKRTRYGVNETSSLQDNNTVKDNLFSGHRTGAVETKGANTEVYDNKGYVTENSGNKDMADGDLIAHGLEETPTFVSLTASKQGHHASASIVNASDIAVELTDSSGAAVTTAETIYWEAKVR